MAEKWKQKGQEEEAGRKWDELKEGVSDLEDSTISLEVTGWYGWANQTDETVASVEAYWGC